MWHGLGNQRLPWVTSGYRGHPAGWVLDESGKVREEVLWTRAG